ncbi:hypothetical protein G6F27_001441 [Rhizopus arrhizus]|nr:hypothetical protein G6F27_001441 [Rhizopus arrhizus]
MHRVRSKGLSSRVAPNYQWVKPKDRITQWNIVTGDKVAVIAATQKQTPGAAKKHVPKQPALPDGIFRKEMPIHYSNVMLLHPDTQMPTRIDRRKVEKTLEDGRIISCWTRFVKGTEIEIPKPERKYNNQSGEEQFTTAADDVLAVTYKPDLTQPPFPSEIVKELRNVYKKKTVSLA